MPTKTDGGFWLSPSRKIVLLLVILQSEAMPDGHIKTWIRDRRREQNKLAKRRSRKLALPQMTPLLLTQESNKVCDKK